MTPPRCELMGICQNNVPNYQLYVPKSWIGNSDKYLVFVRIEAYTFSPAKSCLYTSAEFLDFCVLFRMCFLKQLFDKTCMLLIA